MKSWFKKIIEKRPKDKKTGDEAEKNDNISSLYEIVEDHLRSLDYDQIKSISGDFSERFAAHRETVSDIIRATPPPRMEREGRDTEKATDDFSESVVIDTRPRYSPGGGAYPDELALAHYDRMIRSQYDRLIDLTAAFLKQVIETEVQRLESMTEHVALELADLREVQTEKMERLKADLTEEFEELQEGLDETLGRHEQLIAALDDALVEKERTIALAFKRIRILAVAIIGAALVGGAALVFSLIQ